MEGGLLPAGPLEKSLAGQHRSIKAASAHRIFAHIRRQQRHVAECAAVELQMIPRLLRQDECNGLAGNRVAIPIWKLKVIESARQARAVVDARPRRFADAVVRPPPPAPYVECIVDLHLAHGGVRRGQRSGNIAGAVPAVMEPPFLLRLRVCQAAMNSRNIPRRFARGERSHILVRERAVVDSQLVEVAASVITIAALHARGTDDAGVRPELIQPGIEHSRGSFFGHHFAVHVKTDAGGLVPGECEMHPLIRLGKAGHGVRNARPTQVHIGNEGIEAVTVVIDA